MTGIYMYKNKLLRGKNKAMLKLSQKDYLFRYSKSLTNKSI